MNPSVDAGDSFVGALPGSLQQGHPLLKPGTGLSLPQGVRRPPPVVQLVAA